MGLVFAGEVHASGVLKRVYIVQYDPIFASLGNQRLRIARGWANPETLENQFITKVNQLSGGYATYTVVGRSEVNDIPVKGDGFDYTEQSYLACLNGQGPCHSSDIANYLTIINNFDLCGRVNRNEIDEVWLWGGPWFGFWEAVMAGPGAFNTNAPPITGTSCQRQLNIMGFSYERGVTEMLHDLAHRFEGTMAYIYGEDPRWNGEGSTLWGKFASPNHCGWIHLPPNATNQYDWTNTRQVNSKCEDWLNFPALTGNAAPLTCANWGCTPLGFHEWWLAHIPKTAGQTDGKWNNWWRYVFNYENNAIVNPNISIIRSMIANYLGQQAGAKITVLEIVKNWLQL